MSEDYMPLLARLDDHIADLDPQKGYSNNKQRRELWFALRNIRDLLAEMSAQLKVTARGDGSQAE